MSKRGAGECLATFERKLQKNAAKQAVAAVKKQCKDQPSRSYVAKGLVNALGQGEEEQADTAITLWPSSYSTLKKYPQNQKEKCLLACAYKNENQNRKIYRPPDSGTPVRVSLWS